MNYFVIDVREPDEFAGGHVNGAINIPLQKLLDNAKELASTTKDAPIIVYCRSGSRSNVAKNTLQQQGYTNITNGINQQQVEADYGL